MKWMLLSSMLFGCLPSGGGGGSDGGGGGGGGDAGSADAALQTDGGGGDAGCELPPPPPAPDCSPEGAGLEAAQEVPFEVWSVERAPFLPDGCRFQVALPLLVIESEEALAEWLECGGDEPAPSGFDFTRQRIVTVFVDERPDAAIEWVREDGEVVIGTSEPSYCGGVAPESPFFVLALPAGDSEVRVERCAFDSGPCGDCHLVCEPEPHLECAAPP
jgi:hypothetical protein